MNKEKLCVDLWHILSGHHGQDTGLFVGHQSGFARKRRLARRAKAQEPAAAAKGAIVPSDVKEYNSVRGCNR